MICIDSQYKHLTFFLTFKLSTNINIELSWIHFQKSFFKSQQLRLFPVFFMWLQYLIFIIDNSVDIKLYGIIVLFIFILDLIFDHKFFFHHRQLLHLIYIVFLMFCYFHQVFMKLVYNQAKISFMLNRNFKVSADLILNIKFFKRILHIWLIEKYSIT